MDVIAHRELRNDSAGVLRRVQNGESLLISNKGVKVAYIAPASGKVLDDLLEIGSVRPAKASLSSLKDIARRHSEKSTQEIVDDLRGRW